jgi:nucleoside-diphosphate-sugar epimerase
MSVLVTGGAGRLGYLVSKLLKGNDHTVRVFDLPGVQWSHVEQLPDIIVQKGDITSKEDVQEACDGAKFVVHLAAILPPKSEINEGLTHRVNVEGTVNLIECLDKGTSIVFASSISTYGITFKKETPINVNAPLIAHNNYSSSKILAENVIKTSGVPYTILRIAPLSVADIVELPEAIPYKEDQRVEFILVEDAARAIKKCVTSSNVTNKIFNIAGGSTWQMTGKEYIERFYNALGVEVDPVFSSEYTAIDWYDTVKSQRLGYQRTTFNQFEKQLMIIGEEQGLR